MGASAGTRQRKTRPVSAPRPSRGPQDMNIMPPSTSRPANPCRNTAQAQTKAPKRDQRQPAHLHHRQRSCQATQPNTGAALPGAARLGPPQPGCRAGWPLEPARGHQQHPGSHRTGHPASTHDSQRGARTPSLPPSNPWDPPNPRFKRWTSNKKPNLTYRRAMWVYQEATAGGRVSEGQ